LSHHISCMVYVTGHGNVDYRVLNRAYWPCDGSSDCCIIVYGIVFTGRVTGRALTVILRIVSWSRQSCNGLISMH
jgi:hypothetical protein